MPAYVYPGNPDYDELCEAADSPRAKTVAYDGRIWRKCKDGDEVYFVSVDRTPRPSREAYSPDSDFLDLYDSE